MRDTIIKLLNSLIPVMTLLIGICSPFILTAQLSTECSLEWKTWYVVNQPTGSNNNGAVYIDIEGGYDENLDGDDYYDNIYYTVSHSKIPNPVEQRFPVNGIIEGLYSGYTSIELISYKYEGGVRIPCIREIYVDFDLHPSDTDLEFTVVTANASSCGVKDGRINVDVSGGNSPYTYKLSNASILESDLETGVLPYNITFSVTPGKYILEVTDGSGVTISNSNILVQADDGGLDLSPTTIVPAGCAGKDGAFILPIVTSTIPYLCYLNKKNVIYLSAVADREMKINNLPAGSHTWEVYDATGCGASGRVTVPNSGVGGLEVTATPTGIPCNGTTGSIALEITGGAAPYIYTYGANTSEPFTGNTMVTGLAEGDYSILVTDSHGCTFECKNIFVNREARQEFTCTNGYPDGYNDPSTDYPYPEVFGKTYIRIQVAGTKNIQDYTGPFIAPGTKIKYLSAPNGAPDSKFGPVGSSYTIPADFDSRFFYLFGPGDNHKQSSDIVDTGHFETMTPGDYEFEITNSCGTAEIVRFTQNKALKTTPFTFTPKTHISGQGMKIEPSGSIRLVDAADNVLNELPTYYRILSSTATGYSTDVIQEGETLFLPESGTYILSMSGINSNAADYSAETLTIVYDGNLALDQDQTVAYVCREGNGSFIQAKALNGNPPYRYLLVATGDENETGIFENSPITPGQELDIKITDHLLQSLLITVPVLDLSVTPITYPAVIEVCEGETVQLNALYLGEGTTYTWSGPGNFSSMEQRPQILNVTAAMEGTYMVTCIPPGCGTPISDMIRVAVASSPVSGFDVHNTRYGENTVFINQSTGDMISYYWSLGDGTTSHSAEVTHLYEAPGTYLVELTVTNRAGCTDRFTKYVEIIEDIPAGTGDIASDNNGLLVYPNPVGRGQYLTVETGLSAEQLPKARLYINDLSGRLIRTQEIISKQMTVQMPSDPGIYLLMIHSGESGKTVKIVVK